jgi:hypothetical protein
MHQQDYNQQPYGNQPQYNYGNDNRQSNENYDNPAKKQRKTNVAALEKHQQDIAAQDPSRV